MATQIEAPKTSLVNAKQLLQLLWAKESRPGIAWLREHTGKEVPAVKIGRLYFYSPDKVKTKLGL